jgi:hypothetical protein
MAVASTESYVAHPASAYLAKQVASDASENGEFNRLSQRLLMGYGETRIGSLFDIGLSAHCASRQRLLSSHSMISKELHASWSHLFNTSVLANRLLLAHFSMLFWWRTTSYRHRMQMYNLFLFDRDEVNQ